MDGPAQLCNEHEIIEMTGLKRGVLTIIDKREQFAGIKRKLFSP